MSTSSNEPSQTSSNGSGQASSNGTTSSNGSSQASFNGTGQTSSNEPSHIFSNEPGQTSSNGPGHNPTCVLLVALYHPTVRIPIPYTNQPLIFGKADFEGFDIDSAQSLESPQFSFIVFWDEWERVTFALRDLSVSGTYVNGLHASGIRSVTYESYITFGDAPSIDGRPLVLQIRKLHSTPRISDSFLVEDHILGIGGYAVVKRATRHCTGTRFAVKVIRRCNLPGFSDDPTEREIDIIRSIEHPNIVHIVDTFRDISHHWIVMELAPFGTLQDHLDENKEGLDENLVLATARSICPALKYLHRLKYIHRDVKPANLLVFSMNPPLIKLSDFGLSRKFINSQAFQSIVGTESYMAPEMKNFQRYDAGADVWSLGRTLFSLLCGSKTNHLHRLPLMQHIPAKEVLTGMLADDPVTRWRLEEVMQSPWLDTVGE